MSQHSDELVKLVQARGVPIVLLERIDGEEYGRKRKYSAIDPESSDSDGANKYYKYNVFHLSDSKAYHSNDDDGDSGIDGCSSIQSSANGISISPFTDLLHDEDFFSESSSSSARKDRKLPLENGQYIVQKVVQHRYSPEGKHLFLIKWQGWGSDSNTWEPLKNLHCPEPLTAFFKKLVLEALALPRGKASIPHCPPYNDLAYKEVIKQWTNNVSVSKLLYSLRHNPGGRPLGMVKLVKMLGEAIQLGVNSKSSALIEEIKANCLLWKRFHLRKIQKAKLKAWEDHVNSMGPGGLSIENVVDFEVPPENFKFVTQCIMGKDVEPPQPALVGCECKNCDASQERCCPDLANVEFAYTRHQLFALDRGYAIYECNSLCKCGPDCLNRVVQKGRQVRLCVFRTNNGRGWGVRAGQHIRKGTFISTYIGEVLTVEEAEKRSIEYEKQGLAYLFDLDYTYDEECSYSVDATYVGNESHFINHSCDPNSYIVGVYHENLDPKMPLLALFASRNIARGEEITFNYSPNSNSEDDLSSSPRNSTKSKISVNCKCGAKKCRKYLFNTRMTADESMKEST